MPLENAVPFGTAGREGKRDGGPGGETAWLQAQWRVSMCGYGGDK